MAYRDEVLADNPVGYWRLGEASGTVAQDETANNLDGTYMNTPTLGVAGAIVDGNTAASFASSSSEYVSVPDNNLLDTGDVFTLEAWVKMSSISDAISRPIVDKGTNSYILSITNGEIQLWKSLGSSGATVIAKSTPDILDTTNWHHVVATKNGSVAKIYLDGIDVTTAVTNATIANTKWPPKGAANYLFRIYLLSRTIS